MATLNSLNSNLAELYPQDYREHEWTRAENEQLLTPVINELSSGQNIEQLERFAKAYLGMYLDLDNTIPPHDRIEILTSALLAGEIKKGFRAVLQNFSFPSPAEIADSIYKEDLPEGYILLAALDIYSDDPKLTVSELPSQTIVAAICFHYAYQTEIQDRWLTATIQQRGKEVGQALTAFWLQLIKHGTDHLPGLYQFIEHRNHDELSKDIMLPILSNWRDVRKKVLRKLLLTAIRTTDPDALLDVCKASLESWNPAEPGRYILWLATAFLLKPNDYASMLTQYCGRTKEKIIPLVDFVYLALMDDECNQANIDAGCLATLLRIIAPKVTPQEDRYGQLCDNTRKVMYLFYRLASCRASDGPALEPAIDKLKQVRVMKLYNPVLDYISASGDTSLTFEAFLDQLVRQNLIKARIKRYD
jgi:hypothetical protein